jgi:hypothetical protein
MRTGDSVFGLTKNQEVVGSDSFLLLTGIIGNVPKNSYILFGIDLL